MCIIICNINNDDDADDNGDDDNDDDDELNRPPPDIDKKKRKPYPTLPDANFPNSGQTNPLSSWPTYTK